MTRFHKICRDLLFVYVLLMLWLLFGQRIGPGLWESYPQRLAQNCNLSPFSTVAEFIGILRAGIRSGAARHAFVNLAGNMIMFVPLGSLLPGSFAGLRRFGMCMAVCTGLLIAVELIQLFTLLGVCDVDDLMLNLAGAALGYLLYASAGKLRHSA